MADAGAADLFKTPENSPHSTLSTTPSDVDEYHRLDQQVYARFQTYTPRQVNDDTIKLLRLFVEYLPKDGAHVLKRDILECDDDQSLWELGSNLVGTLLKPLKAAGGRTTQPTPTPMLEAKEQVDELMANIEPSTRAGQKQLKHLCLERDSYKCVLSHYLDESKQLDPVATAAASSIEVTECCHIFPYSLASFDPDKAAETERKAEIWASLHRYFPATKNIISAQSCNKLENALTLIGTLHRHFGTFAIAFQAIHDEANAYRILTFDSVIHNKSSSVRVLPADRIVRLSSANPGLALPHPELLRAHCAIAKILHVSGIGASVETILREMDDNMPRALNTDGSTDIASIINLNVLMGFLKRTEKAARPGV